GPGVEAEGDATGQLRGAVPVEDDMPADDLGITLELLETVADEVAAGPRALTGHRDRVAGSPNRRSRGESHVDPLLQVDLGGCLEIGECPFPPCRSGP